MSHPRLFRLVCLLVLLLALLCAWLLAPSLHAAQALPILSVFSVNDRGTADLLPGGRVLIVAELRSAELRTATLRIDSPAGLRLEAADASGGSLAVSDMYPPDTPPPGVLWTGAVSSTQPINLRLLYQVPSTAAVGDLLVSVTGQADTMALAASTRIRVCCVPAPEAQRPGWRVYLPVIR